MHSHICLLRDLPGMAAEFEQQLAQLGIQNTAQLLQHSRTPQAKEALARRLHQPLRYVNKWVALADLARVPSVGCQYSGLLLHAGIISVRQLAETASGTLHARLRRLHTVTLSRSDLCPDPGQVNAWIQEARQLSTRS